MSVASIELPANGRLDQTSRDEAPSSRKKVLICAYSCEPHRGSEPGTGWHVLREAALRHDVWLLTRPHGAAKIEAELKALGITSVTPLYYDLPIVGPIWRKKHLLGLRLHNYLWQFGAGRLAKRVHNEVKFDVAHHVTFVNYYTLSAAAGAGCPLVWGAVGGAEEAPKAFNPSFSLFGRAYEAFRKFRRLAGELDPFTRRTARRATVGVSTTRESAERMKKIGSRVDEIMSECGVTTVEADQVSDFPIRDGNTVRFISVGRLLHWKGFYLALSAFLKLNDDSEFWIVGDGPDRPRLEAMAAASPRGNRVKFVGAVPRARVLELLRDADVMLHPSLHDSGGVTPIEGMAAGRPVICLNLGGVATKVPDDAGIKVDALTPDQTVNDLARAMEKLSADSALRKQMALRGREVVREEFLWSGIMDRYDRLYDLAITRSGVRR